MTIPPSYLIAALFIGFLLSIDIGMHVFRIRSERRARRLAEAEEAHDRSQLARTEPFPGTPEALATLSWPTHLGGPGERVLRLLSQGLRGVGRHEPARRASDMAESCTDDGDAIRVLHGSFQSNELADVPFPIREVLGIDGDGVLRLTYEGPID